MPKRVQRTRTKGGGMPAGSVYVGRPGKFSNPYRLQTMVDSEADILRRFRAYIEARLRQDPDFLAFLRGKDLACWCPVDSLCHADILLELANG